MSFESRIPTRRLTADKPIEIPYTHKGRSYNLRFKVTDSGDFVRIFAKDTRYPNPRDPDWDPKYTEFYRELGIATSTTNALFYMMWFLRHTDLHLSEFSEPAIMAGAFGQCDGAWNVTGDDSDYWYDRTRSLKGAAVVVDSIRYLSENKDVLAETQKKDRKVLRALKRLSGGRTGYENGDVYEGTDLTPIRVIWRLYKHPEAYNNDLRCEVIKLIRTTMDMDIASILQKLQRVQ